MNSLTLVTPPTEQPVTLEETKLHLRVEDDDEDTLIASYIAASTAHAESFTGLSFIDQTWDYTIDRLSPRSFIELPRPPILEIISFDDGNSPEFDGYEVDVSGGRIYLPVSGSWPITTASVNAATIRYRAGYVDMSESPPVGAVPEDIRVAILLMVGTLYAHRETLIVGQSFSRMPWSAEALLRRHRVETSLA